MPRAGPLIHWPHGLSCRLKAIVHEALSKIPLPQRRRIGKRIDQLAENPRPRGVKKLSSEEELYRIRVGDYRVIYQINDRALLVLVVRIGKRDDVYRNLP